ncbi:MAG: aspartyl protease family protein [Proteobacteria bacterium]|nr:aspartyl protease family protein [Pseudomonadota bacterium]MBS0216962.1 aspartyl protease family protein [Pseudomonadota bacterium]
MEIARTSKRLLLGCTLLFCVGASAAQTTIHLPLEPYRNRLAARIEVAGKPRLFQFDTAGGITLVSPALAKEIGCTPWGSLTGFHMTGAKISAPRCDAVRMAWKDVPLTLPVVGVLDVGSPESPVDGLLSLDAFAGRTISIDFAAGDFVIETPQSAAERIRGAIEVPAHMARELSGRALSMFVDVPTAKGPLRMELDSGNGGTILVSRNNLALLGLDAKTEAPQTGRFTIAPGVEAQGLIFSPDLVLDGNLGMPFLKDWVVTLDLERGRVWLKRSTTRPPARLGVPPATAKGK